MTTQFVTSADETRIAYDITGRSPALMLLHGAGKTRRDWHRLGYVERTKEDFTVITVDIRGNGEALDGANIRVEIIEGLNHQQEFSKIGQVFPAVSSFLTYMLLG